MTGIRRLATLAGRIGRSNLAEPGFPYRLTFAVTSRCQARCIMCDIWRKPADDELSLAEIEAVFRHANRFSWINLTGGELFLRPDILPVMAAIIRQSRDLYLLNFPTNGWLTDAVEEAVTEVLRSGLPRLMVTVSMDGPPELHDRIRNLPGSWERALATFARLRERRSRRFSVHLGYTLQDANLTAFPDTVAACDRAIGRVTANDFHLNVAHRSGHYYANDRFDGLPDPAVAARLLAETAAGRRSHPLSPVSFLERHYQRLAGDYLATGRTPLPCQAAAASCFIDPAGIVYPCSGFDAPIGSLRESDYDLARIWRSPDYRRVREQVRRGACPGCWTPCEAYQAILARLGRLPGRQS